MRKLILSLILFLGLLTPITAFAAEDPLNSICTNNPNATACQNRDQTPGNNSIFGTDGILTKAARVVTMLVGVAAVILIIIGGLQYTLSSGDSTNVQNAKNTILYAIIGFVVALIAQAIISFVLVRIN